MIRSLSILTLAIASLMISGVAQAQTTMHIAVPNVFGWTVDTDVDARSRVVFAKHTEQMDWTANPSNCTVDQVSVDLDYMSTARKVRIKDLVTNLVDKAVDGIVLYSSPLPSARRTVFKSNARNGGGNGVSCSPVAGPGEGQDWYVDVFTQNVTDF